MQSTRNISGLRAKILNNSIAILRLFSERMDLSSRIAVIKASSGLDLRLRDRELDVIRNSGMGKNFPMRFLT